MSFTDFRNFNSKNKPYVNYTESYYDGDVSCRNESDYRFPVYTPPLKNCTKKCDNYRIPVFDNKSYMCGSEIGKVSDYSCDCRQKCGCKSKENFTHHTHNLNKHNCNIDYKSIYDINLPSNMFQVSKYKTCGLFPYTCSERCKNLYKEKKLNCKNCGEFNPDSSILSKMFIGGPRPRFIYSNESDSMWRNETCTGKTPSDIDS